MSEAKENIPPVHNHQVYINIGSNIHPESNLPQALERLRHYLRVDVVSTAWESAAVGTEGPNFLNAAALICTDLSAEQLKDGVFKDIEETMGRVRTIDKNAPRPIDLDILVYDDVVYDPEIWNRVHLAVPLSELLPDLFHPLTGETLLTISRKLAETTFIKPRKVF